MLKNWLFLFKICLIISLAYLAFFYKHTYVTLEQIYQHQVESSKSKVLLLTIAVGNVWYAPLVKQNRKNYCKKNGYHLRLVETLPNNFNLHPSWAKIYESIQIFNEKSPFEWIFLADLDLFIMNNSIRLESTIRDAIFTSSKSIVRNRMGILDQNFSSIKDRIDFIVSKDRNGFNLGSFLIRNSNFSRELLNKMWTRRGDDKIAKIKFWWEQAVFQRLYQEWKEMRSHVAIVPQRLINAYPNPRDPLVRFRRGDFAVHFPSSQKAYMPLFIQRMLREQPELVDVNKQIINTHCKNKSKIDEVLKDYCG
jgi:hypothetical protein